MVVKTKCVSNAEKKGLNLMGNLDHCIGKHWCLVSPDLLYWHSAISLTWCVEVKLRRTGLTNL